jgi:putative ABC transport system permease protein
VVGGGTASLALRAAVLEALVVVVTAALVVVPAAVVSIPGTIGSPVDTLRPLPAVLLLGVVVMVAVTVAPVLSARRGPVVRHLAAA